MVKYPTDSHGVCVLMSSTDVCAELQISLSTLYSWRSAGQAPPALKVGKHLRFPRKGFEEWLADRTNRPTMYPVDPAPRRLRSVH